MLKKLLLAGAAVMLVSGAASAKDLNAIGITLGSLGNPFFVALAAGAEAKAKEINPNVKVNTASADYDLNKQFNQIDNFIASGVDMILLNAADAKAIAPAVKRAQAAGIVVVAVDVAAAGVDATVQTNNVQAGEIACQYIVDKLGDKGGNVIIQNGPQVGAVIDRVKGCKEVLAKNPNIKILSDDQDGKGNREGGMNVMQGHLTRLRRHRRACSRSTTRRRSAATSPPSSSAARASSSPRSTARRTSRGRIAGNTMVAGLGQPGSLGDGAEGGRDRLRHHERQEAGRADDPDAVAADHAATTSRTTRAGRPRADLAASARPAAPGRCRPIAARRA